MKRSVRILTCLLAGAGALEGGSRAIDVLACYRDPLRPERRQARPESVLVVGDSAAWGVGVPRTLAWPWRLAGSVTLRCAPRLHSRDALRQLPQWLAEAEPSLVVVAMGRDDAAVVPAPWTEREWTLVYGVRSRGPVLPAEPPAERDPSLVIGAWRAGPVALSLAADGRASLGPRTGGWCVAGDQLQLTTDDGTVARLTWLRHRDVLQLVGASVGGARLFERDALPKDPLARARDALLRGELSEVRARIAHLAASGAPATVLAGLRGDLAAIEGAGGVVPRDFTADGALSPAVLAAFRAVCERAGARVHVVDAADRVPYGDVSAHDRFARRLQEFLP